MKHVPAAEKIFAAGVVLWRTNDEGETEIALVHRSKYSDWSIPKGKCESGEELISCAYRECIEETGFDAKFGPYLGQIEYESSGLEKYVQYWSAKQTGILGKPDPREIDEVRWVLLSDVEGYHLKEGELKIIDRFRNLDLDTDTLILLRHAIAIPREIWDGEDLDRPLDSNGLRQTNRIITTLTPYRIDEIHTSSAVRCYQTIEALARALQMNYFFAEELCDYTFERDPERTFKYLRKLMANDSVTLACSHDPILPEFLAKRYSKQGFHVDQVKLEPADAWVIHHLQGEIISIDFLKAPSLI